MSLAAELPESGPRPRPHQQQAIAAAVRTLTIGDRAQLAMACGSGKTLVGRWLAEQLGAAITLVVVPSLPLVAQTLQEWRSVTDLQFEAFITCSDPTTAAGAAEREAGDGQDVAAPYWARHRARVTTSAGAVASVLTNRLRAWPLVIFFDLPLCARGRRGRPLGERADRPGDRRRSTPARGPIAS